MKKTVPKRCVILGIRGVPAKHGGFESFAERFSLFLIKKGWEVVVYCQERGKGSVYESQWSGIKLVHIPVNGDGALSTIIFDLKATIHSLSYTGIFITLGYNTAIFNVIHRLFRKTNIINMDGIEWHRDKWGLIAKSWFWLNERIGCWVGNHLIADHPKIKEHLATRVRSEKITMIPYGGDEVLGADSTLLDAYGIEPGNFSVIIARPEPENSFLEMVMAFSSKQRNHKLVVLGNFQPAANAFHKSVMDAASNEVIFPGAIYEAPVVQALRFFCPFLLARPPCGRNQPVAC
jgi:hypothetical protein